MRLFSPGLGSHGRQNPAGALEGLPAVHGQDVVQHQDIPLLPGEADRVSVHHVHDVVEVGAGKGSSIRKKDLVQEGMLAAVEKLGAEVASQSEEFGVEIKVVGLVEPHLFAGLGMADHGGALLADPDPVVFVPFESNLIVQTLLLDILFVLRLKDVDPGLVAFIHKVHETAFVGVAGDVF